MAALSDTWPKMPKPTRRLKPGVFKDPLLRTELKVLGDHFKGLKRSKEFQPRARSTGTRSREDRGPVQRTRASNSRAPGVVLASDQSDFAGRKLMLDLPAQKGVLDKLLREVEENEISLEDAANTFEVSYTAAQPLHADDGYHDMEMTESAAGVPGWYQCEQCATLAEQVRALAQSLAGLGARVFNWSIELKPRQRLALANMVLDYLRPCSSIDWDIDFLCFELDNAELRACLNIKDTEKVEMKLQETLKKALLENSVLRKRLCDAGCMADPETEDKLADDTEKDDMQQDSLNQEFEFQEDIDGDPRQRRDERRPRAGVTKRGPSRQAFLVDNTRLGSQVKGLQYRLSERERDIDLEAPLALWGSVVHGVRQGRDWVKVRSGSFLPVQVNNVPVLLPLGSSARPVGPDAAEPLDHAQEHEAPAAWASRLRVVPRPALAYLGGDYEQTPLTVRNEPVYRRRLQKAKDGTVFSPGYLVCEGHGCWALKTKVSQGHVIAYLTDSEVQRAP